MVFTRSSASVSRHTTPAWSPAAFSQTSIDHTIASLAQQQPEAIAIRFRDQTLTYGELNQRANQLAHYLMDCGVQVGDRVAVCVEPSLDIVVSLLGVFKAGAVYVPLDPGYPSDRLAIILDDTEPSVLLTQSHLRLNILTKTIIQLDKDWETIQHYPTHNPEVAIALDQTAYIVYTSGTTGKPKGVMASHQNLQHYIQSATTRLGFSATDVLAAFARFTFSITMFELLSPLVVGGTLVILERSHILDFQRMMQTLQQVSVVHTSPSLMKKLIAYIQENQIDLGLFSHLKHVSCGGDMVPADLLETMKQVFPSAEVYVLYGCSEISCMGCAYPVPRDRTVTKSFVGTPFENVSVRLYDEQQSLVSVGETGEIYFSGPGVVQGYLNRPELTEERFVEIDGQRFYRTGDLGRWNAEGQLEILGRNDFQIQLRGMRIEPAEIELTVRQLAGVRDSVVVARQLWNGEMGLVAYVVLDARSQPTHAAMRQFLQTKLPDYMIPAVFVELEALPVNFNLKVDRAALPAPDFSQIGLDEVSYVAPRTPVEEVLAGIWAQVLKVDRVGVHDDFFILGGNSLLAAQVVSRLRETLQWNVPISRLFEWPTIADLADYLAPLDPDIRMSLVGAEPISVIERDRPLPLSVSQSRLWFLSQLEEGRAYNIPLGFRISGALNIAVLEQSLTELVRRHEVLRTVFPVIDGSPAQVILPPQLFKVSVIDSRSLSAAEKEFVIAQHSQTEAQYQFDLATDLPLRVRVLQLSETESVMWVTMHHIASDGWSIALFRQELSALYDAFAQGHTSSLVELPIQYADFANWQQQWLQGDYLTTQLDYWTQQLADAPPLLELPYDRPRPSVQTFRGETEFFRLDAATTRQLKTLSQTTGTTLFMTLLSGFAILLSRYSRQQDLVIGSPIANRNRPEIESLIGFFINVLALRVDLTENPSFVELLKRVKRMTLDAYSHQDTPFEQVVEALHLDRNLSHSPIFQVMFILQNSPGEAFTLSGLDVSSIPVESGASKYDLTVMMEETADGLVGEFEYNCDLWDRETITRMIGHFQTLLQGIIANPEEAIATFPLMPELERRHVLAMGNDTALDYSKHHCIHQLVEAQAVKAPNEIAVVFDQSTLTYQQLNERANQLAHYLQRLGVGPEVKVGIAMERSLDLVVGLLGILKAGGSYVPMDPAFPSDRLALMLEDSQAPVVITQPSLWEQFAPQTRHTVCLDADWGAIAQCSTENLITSVTSDNLAYTIYTSGSTGKPKGVQIIHQAVVNFLVSMQHEPGLTENDRLLAVTTISFDIAVLEIFLPLMVGARTVLVKRSDAVNADRLSQLLSESGATVMQATPATWQMLVSSGWKGDGNLKMLCGGEALSRPLANQLLERGGSLWNLYGPTETTIWSAVSQVHPGHDPISMGHAIANTQIYLLETHADGQVSPVPVGIPAEVHIGGDGLARGYLNRSDLTQERFIANPFEAGTRLYKTGDLARRRSDGRIEFLGRLDHQIKLRGFRIELGEIEAVLNRQEQIKQAVVLVREDQPGDQRLVAYYMTHTIAQPSASELRQFLKASLPDYMIPAAFVHLESFPLTPNRKVDRKQLPAPDASSDRATEFVAPQTELEQQLADIWQTVLGVERIGIHDNFFELGGHSLSAVRVWSQIEQRLGHSVPMTVLLQSPTIAELSKKIDQGPFQAEEGLGDLVPLRHGKSDKPPLFCLYGILLYRELAEKLDTDRSIYGVYLQEEVDLLKTGDIEQFNARFGSVSIIAARYLQAIRSFQPHGPYYLAGESFGGMIAYEIAQQLRAEGEEVAIVALLDAWVPAHRKVLPWLQRIQRHGQKLIRRGLPYLVNRVQDRLKPIVHHLKQKAANTPDLSSNLSIDLRSQARLQILGSYQLQPYAGGPVVVFRAMERDEFDTCDRALGWAGLVDDLHVFDVPGDHLGILKNPNVTVLADQLRSYLQ